MYLNNGIHELDVISRSCTLATLSYINKTQQYFCFSNQLLI